jgi:acetolactate synthase-1/2/3 large subunit
MSLASHVHEMRACDFIVKRLVDLGVHHVFGVGGANIEDMFSAVQRARPRIRAVLNKHEHAAGTAADAYARLRGLGVVMTTSGGGAMNVVHALAEAKASRVPVLGIIGEPPTNLQGRGAFQDTSGKGDSVDAAAVFQAVTGRCQRVHRASDLPALFAAAIEAIFSDVPGPAVLLIPKDLQTVDIGDAPFAMPVRTTRSSNQSRELLDRACSWLADQRTVVLAGSEVSRSSANLALQGFCDRFDARVATTPDGRDAFDNRHRRFLGVCGAMGHRAVPQALEEAELVVVVGTRLPLLARQGLESILARKRLLFIGRRRPFVSAEQSLHLDGDIAETLTSLTSAPESRVTQAFARVDDADVAAPLPGARLSCASLLCAVDGVVPDSAIVLVDAGNTGASAIHHVRAPRRGRFLVAMGMAGMGYAFGAATGAAFAMGERCVVIAGDGAFFMQGMEVHTAVEHALPITYIVVNNRAHGMCLVRECLLLGENAGYNAFRPSHLGAAIAAMFPGVPAGDCGTHGTLKELLERAMATAGPSFIAAELDDVEVPPFVQFQDRAPRTTTVAREANHA